MIIVKPVPADAFIRVRDNDGNTGWLHDCGAFAYSSNQPHRCGVCWSAGRTGWAHNGTWQRAYVIRQTSEVAS